MGPYVNGVYQVGGRRNKRDWGGGFSNRVGINAHANILSSECDDLLVVSFVFGLICSIL